jgi:malate dehydrogenase (oxaloacetate-decarboxylating)
MEVLIMDVFERSLELHQKTKGKLGVVSKVPLRNQEDLSLIYTPGVAEPCKVIADNEDMVYEYTSKGNMIAVISDGSAVLGLGNIGPKAAIPVMEGKAVLFKELGGVDAIPLVLDTQDTEELIKTIKYLSPMLGGINLEDISAPRCFEIERRLKEELDIPVFHDDQHGTAITVLAGLINAHKVLEKDLSESKVVINGAGAAGIAIGKLLLAYGVKNVVMVDIEGIINRNIPVTMKNSAHEEMSKITNHNLEEGTLKDALKDADAFIGVSRGNLVTSDMVRGMKKDSIIFAMANPVPEIMPDEAKAGGAAIIGTGRPDFPNMVNNILVFPGLMKGALSVRAKEINETMYLAAAVALANAVPVSELNAEKIFPAPLDKKVPCIVSKAVSEAAKKTGAARL